MKVIIVALLVVFSLLPASAIDGTQSQVYAAEPRKTKFSKHFAESLFKVTENEFFSIEIITDKKELKIGKNDAGIIIHDSKGRDAEGAEVKAILWTPSEGKGTGEVLKVKEKGDGLYLIQNFTPQGGGEWELIIKVKKGKVEDSVTFNSKDVK